MAHYGEINFRGPHGRYGKPRKPHFYFFSTTSTRVEKSFHYKISVFVISRSSLMTGPALLRVDQNQIGCL